jgi:hypothetical protein
MRTSENLSPEESSAHSDPEGGLPSPFENSENLPSQREHASSPPASTPSPKHSHSIPSRPSDGCDIKNTTLDVLTCDMKEHPYIFYGSFALFSFVLVCCLRRICKVGNDSRGEYRAVAAQYGDMRFDNTFSDDYSTDGSLSLGEDEDIEESWSKSGKRALEMGSLGSDKNDGLTLEELNG